MHMPKKSVCLVRSASFDVAHITVKVPAAKEVVVRLIYQELLTGNGSVYRYPLDFSANEAIADLQMSVRIAESGPITFCKILTDVPNLNQLSNRTLLQKSESSKSFLSMLQLSALRSPLSALRSPLSALLFLASRLRRCHRLMSHGIRFSNQSEQAKCRPKHQSRRSLRRGTKPRWQ